MVSNKQTYSQHKQNKLHTGGAVAEWVRASTCDRTIDGSTPTAGHFALRNFGNSVNPSLPVSFG